MTEQEQLDRIARIAAEKNEYEKPPRVRFHPGQSELEALFNIALWVGFWGWVGIAIAGAVFGLPAYLIGALFGGTIAGAMAIVPTLLAMSLFGTLRGRLRSPTAMAWAGAASGIVSFGIFDWVDYAGLPLPTWSDDGLVVFPAGAAIVGAIGGRWMAARSMSDFHLITGRGVRSWRQFSIFDLFLLTTWVAVVTALFAGLMPVGDGQQWLAVGWLAFSLVITVMVEGVVLVSGVRRKPRSLRGSPRST